MNILLCTLGSWGVIPEVYGFLAPELLPLYRDHPDRVHFERLRHDAALRTPDEIWVCTSQGQQTRTGIEQLLRWRGLLRAAPVLRIWQAAETNELANQAECRRMQELILRAGLLAHEHAQRGQVLLSLAGGRKTMSADLQWAGSLFGCDALLHVVESGMPEFLKNPEPDDLAKALPLTVTEKGTVKACASVLTPLIVGQGRRSEVLDVDLDGKGAVTTARFPLPLAPDGDPLVWSPAEHGSWLSDELRRREQAGSQLLGNYLAALSQAEHHENWRSLYRLPPRAIEGLRNMRLNPADREWLLALPKADLHRHLGGCLQLAEQRRVGRAIWDDLTPNERDAAMRHVRPLLSQVTWDWTWPEALKADNRALRTHRTAALLVNASDEQLQANLYAATEPRVALKSRHKHGFNAYERPGELSGSALLTHLAAVEPYAASVVNAAADEGLAYLELRGSPQKYGHGPTFLRALEAAIQRAVAALPEHQRPLFRFVVIADRRERGRMGAVVEMAVAAQEELGDFIAGLDLAGDEGTTRPEEIAHHFRPAFEACLPITIHAGETEPADSIWQAAYHLHADRIGHGLSISENKKLAARFRDRGICLELCPSSNREVVGFRDPAHRDSEGLREYPLWDLWLDGMPLTLCTDNPAISRTSVTDEYLTAARMLGQRLSRWDALAMIKQAFVHAFLPSRSKEDLIKRLDTEIYTLMLREVSP